MKLSSWLDFTYQPVGIWFTDEKPEGAFEFDASKRPCVVSMLLAASKGKTVAVSDETCPCPGGAVGLGFGNAFKRRDTPTLWMLSHGLECPDFPEGKTLRPELEQGEKFFRTSNASRQWLADLQLSDAGHRYVVFRPLRDENEYATDGITQPELVWLLADPDQLSALVIMCGYSTGRALNVLAPFCAGCQSIVLAKQQNRLDEPRAIMGMFDISQRHRIPKELLSLTTPYRMFTDIDAHCDNGCLTTHAWKRIEGRFKDEQ